MENFAKPSVLKNHIRSYSCANKTAQDELRNKLDNLVSKQNDFNSLADKITEYSKKRESIIKSLESKFKKYNLDFKQPLISNDLEDIIKYSKELNSQLDISLASLEDEERESVVNDSRIILDEINQLKTFSENIERESKKLIKLEEELNNDAPREKDSDEEIIISFNNHKKEEDNEAKILNFNDFVDEKESEENDDLINEINEELNFDTISSSIFNEEESSELSNLLDNEKSVKVDLNPGSSLVDKVDYVYGEGLIDKIYNYSNNKRVIDKKAKIEHMTPEEAMKDKDALSGIIIDFPTELSFDEDNIIQLPENDDIYNDEENIRRLG